MVREGDLSWVAGFLDDLLLAWRTHADEPNGIFHPYLDRTWRHVVDGPRTLVSQCRLIYNFARAFERSGDQGYADLAQRGIAALTGFFGGAAGEGFVWACHGNGRVQNDTRDAYGHAFVILALATAATTFRDTRYRDLALQTWQFMQRHFRDEHGGLIWHVSPDGRILDDVRSQNPLMHTFEALLTLAPLDESGLVREDALAIWHFLRARMPGPGALPEWYDAGWRPMAEGERAIVEVGHVFEWAFLLSEAQALFPEEDLLEAGREFLRYGMDYGYDTTTGGIFARVAYDGTLRETRKGWWEQCEALRAMCRYVARHAAAEITGPVHQTIAFVREHFVDATYGGWYESPPELGGEPSLAKGHAFKLDYHVVNLCRELLSS